MFKDKYNLTLEQNIFLAKKLIIHGLVLQKGKTKENEDELEV